MASARPCHASNLSSPDRLCPPHTHAELLPPSLEHGEVVRESTRIGRSEQVPRHFRAYVFHTHARPQIHLVLVGRLDDGMVKIVICTAIAVPPLPLLRLVVEHKLAALALLDALLLRKLLPLGHRFALGQRLESRQRRRRLRQLRQPAMLGGLGWEREESVTDALHNPARCV
eukprot:256190-Chlamydomonas_euryale.AAC.2